MHHWIWCKLEASYCILELIKVDDTNLGERNNIQLILVQILLTSMLIFVLNKTLLDFYNSSVIVIINGIGSYDFDRNKNNIKREFMNNMILSF